MRNVHHSCPSNGCDICQHDWPCARLARENNDNTELERLRADLKVQQDAANHWFAEANKDHSRCVKLEAENATLRQALKNHAEEAAKMYAEPVAYEITTHDGIKWIGRHPSILPNHTSIPLYTSPRIPEGWICPRCKVDRLQKPCPDNSANCPMMGQAYAAAPKPEGETK